MTNIAVKYGGTVDKYIGDAIMVFFGDPKTKGPREDAIACVEMALEMNKLSEIRKHGKQKVSPSPLILELVFIPIPVLSGTLALMTASTTPQ